MFCAIRQGVDIAAKFYERINIRHQLSYSIEFCDFQFHLQVLVRNVPPDPDESVTEHIEHFFCVNHPDHYLTHQVGTFFM